jgi:hypothetical protein
MSAFSAISQRRRDPDGSVSKPTLDEQRRQVERVCESTAFTNAEVLRNLLTHLSRASIEQPGRPVKEYEIGLAVLGRKDGFDPRIDSSVRVHCARLRTKLMEYYLGEGASDSIELSIPKGGYHLVSKYRDVAGHVEAPLSPAAPEKVIERKPWLLWCSCALAAVSTVAAIWLWLQLPPAVSAPLRHFWTTFDSRPDETLMVFSNPRFVGSVSSGGLLYEPDGSSTPAKEINDRYTGIGEAMALQHLTRLFERLRLPLRAKRSGLMAWDEARNRSFIFVGAAEVNKPQMELPKLEQFSFKSTSEEPHSGRGAVVNLQPRTGEQQYYLNSGPPYTHDYAVIALLPGLEAGRRALILAGRTTYGTQGAVEFLLDEKSVADLLGRLGAERSALPFFEALVRVKVSGGVPVQPELVILRKRDQRIFAQ